MPLIASQPLIDERNYDQVRAPASVWAYKASTLRVSLARLGLKFAIHHDFWVTAGSVITSSRRRQSQRPRLGIPAEPLGNLPLSHGSLCCGEPLNHGGMETRRAREALAVKCFACPTVQMMRAGGCRQKWASCKIFNNRKLCEHIRTTNSGLGLPCWPRSQRSFWSCRSYRLDCCRLDNMRRTDIPWLTDGIPITSGPASTRSTWTTLPSTTLSTPCWCF